MKGSYMRQLSIEVLPPVGLKWTVARRALRGSGGAVSASETLHQRTSLFAAQRRCISTMAWVALAGAWYVSSTWVQPARLVSFVMGNSVSAIAVAPRR